MKKLFFDENFESLYQKCIGADKILFSDLNDSLNKWFKIKNAYDLFVVIRNVFVVSCDLNYSFTEMKEQLELYRPYNELCNEISNYLNDDPLFYKSFLVYSVLYISVEKNICGVNDFVCNSIEVNDEKNDLVHMIKSVKSCLEDSLKTLKDIEDKISK